ncbi:MAG: enoyl-CoA hydratase [Chloroflexi bacterium]|nr:enoyl-CoA hydratase [Chloroflexota bacterium]
MAYETILFEKTNGVARITLNRPTSYNPLNQAVSDELLDVISRCHTDPEVRVVTITGAGSAFSAGGDIKDMVEALKGDISVMIRRLTTTLHSVVAGLTRLPKPVIAVVNGPTAGAGLALMLACDMAIASEKATFVVAFTGIGASPDTGTTFFLPRLVGLRKAMELTMTNRRLSASEALDLGLLNEVAPEDQFMARADELANKLAKGPTYAYGRAKQLLYGSMGATLETQLENERQSVSDCSISADFGEAVNAFVEKRKPDFKGR